MREHSETKVLASFDVVLTHTSPSLNTVTVPDSLLCVSFARMRIATVLPLPRCFLAYLSGVNLREYCFPVQPPNRSRNQDCHAASLRCEHFEVLETFSGCAVDVSEITQPCGTLFPSICRTLRYCGEIFTKCVENAENEWGRTKEGMCACGSNCVRWIERCEWWGRTDLNRGLTNYEFAALTN